MKYEERYIRENFGVYFTYFSENKYYINRWNFEEDAIAKVYLNIKIHPEYFWRSIRVYLSPLISWILIVWNNEIFTTF